MLTDLRALLEKASCVPAHMPTEVEELGDEFCGLFAHADYDGETWIEDNDNDNPNARLIVAAVNSLPKLLAVAEAANKLHDSHYTPELIRALAALDEGSPDA